MKLLKIFRTQAFLIALGAAMLLPGTVYAQEIDNPVWNDETNVAPSAPTAVPSKAENLKVATDDPNSVTLMAADATPAMAQEASLTPGSVVEGWVAVTFLLSIGLVVFYTTGKEKDQRQVVKSRYQ